MNIKTFLPVLALVCLLGFGIQANAQGTSTPRTSTPTSTAPTYTPSAPNTGTGGNAPMNLIVLGAAGAAMLGGAYYLFSLRTRKE